MHKYFMGQPLLFSTCLQRFGIEWPSLKRWSWVTTRFQAAMSDSISSRLLVGGLFDVSRATLRQKFSIGFRSEDWAGQSSVLVLLWDFHLANSFAPMTWRIVILKQELFMEELLCWWRHALLQYADVLGRFHHSIYDVQTSDSTTSHAVPDHNSQRVLHRQVQTLCRFDLLTRKPPHARVGLVAKQAKSAFIVGQDFSNISQTPAGVLPCSLDSLAPLDISHQRLLACLAAPWNKLQTSATHC